MQLELGKKIGASHVAVLIAAIIVGASFFGSRYYSVSKTEKLRQETVAQQLAAQEEYVRNAEIYNEEYARQQAILEKEPPCSITSTSTQIGETVEEAKITNDFNGNEYPNRYRVVNGEQLQIPCSISYRDRPMFQQLIFVDSATGEWDNIWRAADSEAVGKDIVKGQSVATSTISVLPGGRYVSYRWYGWEWSRPVLYDMTQEKNVASEVFGVDYVYHSAVPVVSHSGKMIVFIGQESAFEGSGWPTIWLGTEFDPLKLKEVYSYSTTSLPEGYGQQVITNVTLSDTVLTFNLEAYSHNDNKNALGTFNYDIPTGWLTSTWDF
ncbi:MAG: hypothetical protein AAB590_03325 [Patescibacteria group bacterium]